MQKTSPYSLLQLASPSPLLSAAAGGPPTSLSVPPPSPFFTPFPPAAAALYQAGLIVNMYAAAAAAFTAASGAPCPSDILPPPPATPSSVAAAPGLDIGHTTNRSDPSVISQGNDHASIVTLFGLEHHSLIFTNCNGFKMLLLARSWRLQRVNTLLQF